MRRLAYRIRTGLVAITGTGAGASAVLGLLVIASVFVSMATPRASLAFRTKALQQIFSTTSPNGRTVFASTDMPTLGAALGPDSQPAFNNMNSHQIAPIGAELGRHIRAIGVPLTPGASWWTVNTAFITAPGAAKSVYFGDVPPQVELIDRPRLNYFSKLVSGRMPSKDAVRRTTAKFEVAVTSLTAAKFRLKVGSVVTLSDQQTGAAATIKLVVTGILRPRHLNSAYWTADANALRATFNKTKGGGYWLGAMFVGDSEMNGLENALTDSSMLVTWEFPLALGKLQANQAAALNAELTDGLVSTGIITTSVITPLTLTPQSALSGGLAEFVQTEGEIGSLLSLLYVSLTIVGLVVLLLGARLLAERRASEFSLIRARGAARHQVVLVTVRAGAVVVVPCAVIGAALAIAATPHQDEPLAYWLGGITAAVTLLAVPWLTLRRIAGTIRPGERADSAVPRRLRVRRIVIDAAAVVAAVGGLIVLRLQGQPTDGSTDWYTSAAPVLIAIPMAIVVVRIYPVVLRWLVALSGRRQGVTTFVGLARAARSSMTAVLPAFALVLVLTVIAFGAMLRSAVVSGDVTASYRQLGADVVIDATLANVPLTPAAQRAIAAVPGVQAATTLAVTSGVTPDGTTYGVLMADPASYAKILAHTPVASFPAGKLAPPPGTSRPTRLPVLTSPGISAALLSQKTILVGVTNLRFQPVGTITSTPGVPQTGPFVLLPAWAASRAMGADTPTDNIMLLKGSVDKAALASVVKRLLPGATTITYRSETLSALTGAPLPHGAFVTFAQAAIEAAGFGAIIMLIMLALGARPRELTLARLLTMGLSQGQARRLVIAEALPSILAATVGGAICALALVPLLGPSINLSPFTGSSAHVPVHASLAVVGYLAAGLVVLALATLFAQATATRLRGVARALRVGE
jgi:putative ABC transport system permease protein